MAVHFNGHTDFGAGLSIFEGRYALANARSRALGEKKHLPWKAAGLDLKKKGVLAAAFHSGKYLLRHIRLEQLHLDGILSLPDAAATAILCGSTHMLHGILFSLAPSSSLHFTLQPDFSGTCSDIRFSGIISVSAGHIISAALIGAWHYSASTRRSAHGKASD